MLLVDLPLETLPSTAAIAHGLNFLTRCKSLPNSNGMFSIISDNPAENQKNPYYNKKDPNGIFHYNQIINGASDVINGACHGNLQNATVKNPSLIATYTHPRKDCNRPSYHAQVEMALTEKQHSEVTNHYYDWLINRSFASRFLIDPISGEGGTSDLSFATGVGLLIRTDIPANLLAAICMLSRHTRERFGRLWFWHHLTTSLDIDEDTAFYFCLSTGAMGATFLKDEASNLQRVLQTTVYGTDIGHTFVRDGNPESYYNWMTRDFKDFNPLYSKVQKYSGVSNMLGMAVCINEQFTKNLLSKISCKIYSENKGVDSAFSIPNPFKPLEIKPTIHCTVEQFITNDGFNSMKEISGVTSNK